MTNKPTQEQINAALYALKELTSLAHRESNEHDFVIEGWFNAIHQVLKAYNPEPVAGDALVCFDLIDDNKTNDVERVLRSIEGQLSLIKEQHDTSHTCSDENRYWRGVRIGLETCLNLFAEQDVDLNTNATRRDHQECGG